MDLDSITINHDATIMDAIRGLSYSQHRCLLVISEQNKLLGVLSEGDILRSISLGNSIYSSIANLFRKDFKYLTCEDKTEAVKIFKEYGITLIPVVDKEFHVKQIITLLDMLDFIDLENEC